MSKNLTRKGLALGTTLAIGLTGLVGIAAPAYAAGEVISVAPKSGSGWGAFNTDNFEVSVKTDTDVITSSAYSKVALELTQADSGTIKFKLSDGSPTATTTNTTFVTGTGNADSCKFDLTVKLSNGALTTTGVATATIADGDTSSNATTNTATCVTLLNGTSYDTDAERASFEYTLDFSPSTTDYTTAAVDLASLASGSFDLDVTTAASATKNSTVGVTAWLDKDEDLIRETGDDAYPSTTETVSFYDASNVGISTTVERFFYDNSGATAVLNEEGDSVLGVAIAFNPALNLDQVDLGGSKFSFTLNENAETTAGAETFTATGVFGYSNYSKVGKIYGTLATTTTTTGVDGGDNFVVATTKEDGDVDITGRSGGYTVPVQESTTSPANVTAVSSIAATPAVDSKQDDSADTFSLRTGAKAFTYTATATSAKANVPVLATVKATTIATGGKISVASRVLVKDEVAIFAGTTDANGKYSLTVTSDLAKAGEAYSVNFYVAETDGDWAAFGAYAASYAGAAPATVTPASTIVAGADVSVNLTVKDQFSQLISANAAGKPLYIEAKATNTSNLKVYLPVTNGVATLAFKNYLAVGGSDTITWTLGTGANATDFVSASVATNTISLYNPAAAASVNAITTQTANITYDDFITGATSATNVAPDQNADVAISGTVVDANGAGIPGAVVTVAASGLQFQKTGGDYYVDSITTTADAAGAFSVNVWAHTANSTGIPVTITSNGKTATTTLKTYLPSTGVNGNNLVFSWNLPANVVKNTTYAVTAKLADKWGNPVATTTNSSTLGVSFQGNGSVEINSSASAVTKNFDKTGTATVFLRSVKDVAGPGSITATLGAANYAAGSGASATALVVSEIASDVAATKWNETLFKNSLESNIEVLEVAPVTTTVGVSGSTGKFYASASNASGKLVVVKVNGKFAKSFVGTVAKKVVAVTAAKGTKTITVYVGGKLVLTKAVTIK